MILADYQSNNNYWRNISYNQCTTHTKVISIVSTIFSFSLIFLGVYGYYYLNLALWETCTLVALGIAWLTATCIGGVWKVCRSPEETGTTRRSTFRANSTTDANNLFEVEGERSNTQIHPPISITPFSKRIETLLSPTQMQEWILPYDILVRIFSYLGGCLSDFSNTSLVCKKWYFAINREGSQSKQILDELYGHGFPLHRQMSGQISQIISPNNAWMIPTISDMLDLDNLIGLLPRFQERKSSILKGQDANGGWFFIIRCQWNLGSGPSEVRPLSYPRKGDAVVALLQIKPWTKSWIIMGASSPDRAPFIIPEEGLDLSASTAYGEGDRSLVGWVKKLINNEPCGVLWYDQVNQLCQIVLDITSLKIKQD